MEMKFDLVGAFTGIRSAVVNANRALAAGKSVRIFADTNNYEVWAVCRLRRL